MPQGVKKFVLIGWGLTLSLLLVNFLRLGGVFLLVAGPVALLVLPVFLGFTFLAYKLLRWGLAVDVNAPQIENGEAKVLLVIALVLLVIVLPMLVIGSVLGVIRHGFLIDPI